MKLFFCLKYQKLDSHTICKDKEKGEGFADNHRTKNQRP